MRLEEQCCTVEQGERLKELGVAAGPIFSHFEITAHKGICFTSWSRRHIGILTGVFPMEEKIKLVPVYTVAELGEMLPSEEYTMRTGIYNSPYAQWDCRNDGNEFASGLFVNEAQARAYRLIKLLESGEIDVRDINLKAVPF